ncbi:MAG TPA: BMP family ABC transporter substrate-binding protein [Candidatus Korarchaeota archaeon]|nr:BMP family ABC transporter substrate-binding protein [Candidatus Korarchaeota archaeon]
MFDIFELCRARGEEKLKVIILFDTKKTECGWNEAAYNGLLEASRRFDQVSISYVESVHLDRWADCLKEVAELGFSLVISHASPVEEQIKEAAEAYPETLFVWSTGKTPVPENVVVIDFLAHEASYLAGILAAGMSETGKIGVIGGMPAPSFYRTYYSFVKGVEELRPEAEVKVQWVGTFVDVTKGFQEALEFIEEGCDVIWGNGNGQNVGARNACLSVIGKRKVWYIGGIIDEHKYAPPICITSVLFGIERAIPDVIGRALEGKLRGGELIEYRLREGADLAPYYGLERFIPEDLRERVSRRRQEIIEGKFTVPRKDSPD